MDIATFLKEKFKFSDTTHPIPPYVNWDTIASAFEEYMKGQKLKNPTGQSWDIDVLKKIGDLLEEGDRKKRSLVEVMDLLK